jgi:hypothetical protein
MPYCPKCRYEYRSGVKKCEDCDVRLVDTLTPEITIPVELVPCWRTTNYVEADGMSVILRDKNIPCNIEDIGGLADGAYVVPAVRPRIYTLLVPEDQLEEATKVIEEQGHRGNDEV